MAMHLFFNCSKCGKSISSWDEGNPYYFDERGAKQYAYHPHHENLAKCVGNDLPHLCFGCGATFLLDTNAKQNSCPKCKSPNIESQFKLEGCLCPYCKEGKFVIDPSKNLIS